MPPLVYSEELAAKILAELEDGKGLRTICRELGIVRRTVRKWVTEDYEGFGARYVRARDIGYDEVAEDIIEISDDGTRDYSVTEDGAEIVNHDHINRARLRVDSRKWLLAKLAPKRYGDKLDVGVAGSFTIKVMSYADAD